MRVRLGDRDLCDRCFDRRIAAATGYPELPEPPGPEVRVGADGRPRRFRYRLWRAPGGIVAEASEDAPEGDGCFVEVVGPHDADVGKLLDDLEARLARQIGTLDLERHEGREGWTISGFDLRGRLESAGYPSGPHDVVVDGRRFSWREFGRILEPFEGCEFHLTFDQGETDGGS